MAVLHTNTPRAPLGTRPRGTWVHTGVLVAAMAVPAWASAAALNDIAASAGIQFFHESETLAPIGAGAAWVDVDGDGDDDLYAVQATGCNRLFLNEGTGSFIEVAGAAGADDCAGVAHGVGAADYDNDGDQDLFVTNYGQNRLFRNLSVENATLEYSDVTVDAGMGDDGGHNSSSAVWGDYDKDGLLDLFVGNHSVFPIVVVGPSCHADYLWHNEGDGTFTDVASATGVGLSGELGRPGCALAAVWSDYDNDGDSDLVVQNDFGKINDVGNRLFRNDGADGAGGWIFADQSAEAAFGIEQAGMGIAVGDLDRDGYFDYYMADRGSNELMYNNGDGTFDEIAAAAGVEANDVEIYLGNGLVSWGDGFFDLDLDGWEEIVVANGGAPRDKWPYGMFGSDYIDLNPNYVYRNLGNGTFAELHEPLGVTLEGYYRTAVFTDYDDDGDVDIYFGNMDGVNAFYQNDLPTNNNWLKVKVVGTVGNRDGVGARINLDAAGATQIREIRAGSGFLSRDSLTGHFGLGTADTVDRLTVTFLSGLRYEFVDLAAAQTVEVVEPIVTGDFPIDTLTISAGEPIPLSITVRNHTDLPQAIQLWVDYVSPAGVQQTLYGPFDRSLQANGGFARPLTIPGTPGVQPGTHVFVLRVGTYPDAPLHQDYLLIDVGP